MTLGWYVHHHGDGHRQRFMAVSRHLEDVVALSSLPAPPGRGDRWRRLPMDAPGGGGDPTAGGVLHWAPLGHDGLRERMAALARFVEQAQPDAMVVDVSVEVALYVRLMGIPVIWIGQRGVRSDPAHRAVFAFARLIVPWTPAVAGDAPGDRADTRYSGAFSRLDGRVPSPAPGHGRVLVLLGLGGDTVTAAQLAAAESATPGWRWRLPRDADDPDALWRDLMDSDVVVGSAGSNVVAEIAAARRPFVCLPQDRPFAEQVDQGRALQAAGLAECRERWPSAAEWPDLLDRAIRRDPARWSILHDGDGARRMAAHVRELACASR